MDKFFYDIWYHPIGKFAFQLYVEAEDGDDCDVFDEELYFDTYEEAEEHKDSLPDFAYHIEQLGDV